jgi:modulator of FtsH protease
MSYAYDVSAWHDFALGLTSASAALTGLVFVAMSIHLREVLAAPIDRRRAEGAFFSLLTILGFAVVALFAGITRQAYGSCAVAVALVQLGRSAQGALLFRIGDPESEAWVTLVGGVVSYVAMLWGGIGLLIRSGGGMYVLAAALVVNGALVLRVVWSIFVSISEEEAIGEVPREDA